MTTKTTLEEMLYNAFRRAYGAWTETDEDGTVRLCIGEYADSPTACGWPSKMNTSVEKIGWIKGSDLGGTGACGEDIYVTAAEFADFVALPDFVAFESDEAADEARRIEAEMNARFVAMGLR